MADSFSVKPVPDLLSGVVCNCAGIRMRRWGWRPGFCFQCHYSSQLWSDRQASREKKAKQGAGIVLDDSVCMLHWCSFSLCWLSRPLLGLLGSVFQYKKQLFPSFWAKFMISPIDLEDLYQEHFESLMGMWLSCTGCLVNLPSLWALSWVGRGVR